MRPTGAHCFLHPSSLILSKGRWWDSHPHRTALRVRRLSVSSHTGTSRSARIRTLCGCFGGSLLSQEHTPDNQCVWRELNPAPRGSQPRMHAFTPQTPSTSSPGWNRTTDLLRVGEAPWPLDHGTMSEDRDQKSGISYSH